MFESVRAVQFVLCLDFHQNAYSIRGGISTQQTAMNLLLVNSTPFTIYGFETTRVNPRYPHANGEAERAVAIAKCILRQKDSSKAFMVYRAIHYRESRQ